MDPAYAARYEELYRRHWWWRARDAVVVKTLARLAPTDGFGRILDVGCGDGLFFGRLRRFGEPEGVEPDESLLTPRGRARGQIFAVPFDDRFQPGRRYGLVVMLDVLEHLPEPVAALSRVADLLEPGGRCLLTLPAMPCLWTSHDEFNRHRTRYTRAMLRYQAGRAGLRVRWARYLFHWLVPLKLGLRAWEAIWPGEPRPATVPSPPLNRLLLSVCRLEEILLAKAGLPFGSSLLAVLGGGGRG